jgi:hypothetical protein
MMNLKFSTIFLAFLVVSFQMTAGMAAGPKGDPYTGIVLPIFQGAYDIESRANRLQGTQTLKYKIQTRYPAGEVLEFYDAALNAGGWKPSFEICQRHWADPNDGDIKTDLPVKQLFTSWQHPQYKLQISLLLEYHGPGASGRDEVLVRCRLQPQPDDTRQEKEIQ